MVRKPGLLFTCLCAATTFLYFDISALGLVHVSEMLVHGVAGMDLHDLDRCAVALFAMYLWDVLLAVCWRPLLWQWTLSDVIHHHMLVIGALSATWASGLSPAHVAPELLAVGLWIEYNESLWALLSLWRPPWLQRAQVLVRASVFPPLLVADLVTYTKAVLAELTAWVEGRPWSPMKLALLQVVLLMAHGHYKALFGSARLCAKLARGQFRIASEEAHDD